MIDTSARLLRLLSVLQGRRFWRGPELAARVEVTPRTLRRDIDRLRRLGYRIESTGGPGGGYQLGKGTEMPPLLLTGDEGVAVALALRVAADSFQKLGDTVVSVLVKLEQLLPKNLRRRVGALEAATVSIAGRRSDLDPNVLTTVAAACRDCERLRFGYRDQSGKRSQRHVEPIKVVHASSRLWYLVAWDLEREALRIFRIDRITHEPRIGDRFVPRNQPEDVEVFVAESIAQAPKGLRACVRLHAHAKDMAAQVPCWAGEIQPEDDEHCLFYTRASSLEYLLCNLVVLGVDFELIEPMELAPKLREVGQRLTRAGRLSASEPAPAP